MKRESRGHWHSFSLTYDRVRTRKKK